MIAQYAYDAQGQLIQERLTQLGILYEYSYDTSGNLRTVKTTKGGTTTTKTYSYTDGSWKDLLTAVDGKSLTYDAIGNPLTYYNGQSWAFTWKGGRQLATAKSGDTSVSYNYDAQGLRTSKTVGSTTYYYVYLGDKLVRQTWGSNKLDFAYDEQGRPYSMTFNGTTYFYVLNLQGDVISLVDASGAVKATYTYDAWGNAVVSSGALVNVNPLRYRGYYYDFQTQMYYLNSRYYDPANRRFISADGTDVLAIEQGSVVQFNLFAYCLNNPVQCIDSEGQLGTLATAALIGGITGAVWGGISAAMSGGNVAQSMASGLIFGSMAGIVCATDGMTIMLKAIAGAGFSVLSYWGSDMNNANWLGAGVATFTGGMGASISGFQAFQNLGNLADSVISWVTAGINNISTGIASTIVNSQSTTASQNTAVKYTTKKPLLVKSTRYHPNRFSLYRISLER